MIPSPPRNRKPTSIDQCVGRNIRTMRLLAGQSQQDVAHILGITFQQVQKYEKGTNRLPLSMLLALKDFYRVPFENFFSGLAPVTPTRDVAAADLSALSDCDDEAVRLCRRLSTIGDRHLQHKIIRVVEILLS